MKKRFGYIYKIIDHDLMINIGWTK